MLSYCSERYNLIGEDSLTDAKNGGRCHIFLDGEREAGLCLYKQCIDSGRSGLCVTRSRSPVLVDNAPPQLTFRLSSLVGKGNLRPDQLGLLQKVIFDFIDEHPKAGIFLEGLDYILVEKEFKDLVRFLYSLGDKAMDFDAIVIVSLHGTGLDSSKAATLKQALVPVPI
ncbi:MAG: DUF835 domain-containing protein [Methanobacteriota archaeon]